jgi:tRNA-Thr(GGU) m(6)t(6)A37 methyltransferase TsaA
VTNDEIRLRQIGHVRSSLRSLDDAPRQGDEGAPTARIEIAESAHAALHGVAVGDDLLVLTWLHRGQRDVLEVHPRGDTSRPLTGVFATRSPDRPNPIGLHRVRVLRVDAGVLEVAPLEAIDGTPVVDIKPVLGDER